jgi:hypothetical protein
MPCRWNIRVVDPSPTSKFAADEFARLITLMDDGAAAEVSFGRYAPGAKALWIGLDPALPPPDEVADPEFDDAIHIDVRNGAGYITGSNVRSVLIGVYRFFREAGCVFVRPGPDGEFVPRRKSCELAVSVRESARYRHRGLCLEGAASYENVAELIDFAPKLGFNAYFTQLFRPAFAFRRWYGHQNNPTLAPEPLSDADIDRFVENYDRELKKRGMFHHRIGHGWIPKVLGITSGAWHEANREDEADPEKLGLTALVGGRRGLFGGSAIDTNFCLSDPRAAELLADEVVNYARANPEVRCLHFWLADHANNQCECENCKDRRPADQYVELLNLLDEKLTAAKLDTRIFFLVYLDLLWEPVEAKLKNPARFTLVYAPIRRSYSVPMAEDKGHEAVPFVRNGFVPVPEAGGTLPYLAAWQQNFGGECVVFDYHYMWDYLNDPGGIQCARIAERDAEILGWLGLNGMLCCQNQRVFMPDGIGMFLIGETMWTGWADFPMRAGEYFPAAYGDDGMEVMSYLLGLSRRFAPWVLRGEEPVADMAETYRAIPSFINGFLPTVRKNLKKNLPAVQHRSWECLEFHAAVCRKLAVLLLACARGKLADMDERWAEVRDFVCENELKFQREFDVFEFVLVWENKILPRLRAGNEQAIE